MPNNEAMGVVNDLHRRNFAENIDMAIQRQHSVFRDKFSYINNLSGEDMQITELLGSVKANRGRADGVATPNVEVPHLGIYVVPEKIDIGQQLKRSDDIGHMVSLRGPYVKVLAAAMVRGQDEILAEAFFGPRLLRRSESKIPEAVAFDTANQVVANNYQYGGGGSASGLTVQKIVRGLTVMGMTDLNIDVEDIYLAITPEESEDLYNDIKYVSMDYQNRAQFNDKMARSLMGVQFCYYTDLPLDVSGHRRCPMWAKSGMHWGDAIPLFTRVNEIGSQSYTPHLYMEEWLAATRSEDQKVVDIRCA